MDVRRTQETAVPTVAQACWKVMVASTDRSQACRRMDAVPSPEEQEGAGRTTALPSVERVVARALARPGTRHLRASGSSSETPLLRASRCVRADALQRPWGCP